MRPEGLYVDGTFGRGGHSAAILERLGSEGRLLALDRDSAAVAFGRQRFGEEQRLFIVQASFSGLSEMLRRVHPDRLVDGVLLDLGISSPQLEDPARGFSFAVEGPLDMRMDTTSEITAARWLARASERDIGDVIRRYGEERYWRRIARAIVGARRRAPITATSELARIVAGAIPRRERRLHPATRTFQAIRIWINDELEELRACLEQLPGLLAPMGRLCVISFHSLEDRIVKHFIRRQSGRGEDAVRPALLRPIGKLIRPGAAESAANPRARSARLRIAERLP